MFNQPHLFTKYQFDKVQKSNLINKLLFSFFLFIVFSTSSFGQGIQDLGNKLLVLKSSPDSAIQAEGVHLKSLTSDLLPSIYFQQGELAGTYKNNPTILFTDISSIPLLSNSNPLFSKIEIISIRIKKQEDMQKVVLKLSDLSGFENLKYIYFLCDFSICPEQPENIACENEKISEIVQNNGNHLIEILYKINIGS